MTVDEIIDAIIEREGGFSDVLGDAGGPTNYGITIREYAAYLGHWPTLQDMKEMPRETAVTIYKKKYLPPWEFIPWEPLKVLMIDTGVLHGIVGAKKLLQHTLGVVEDGIIGPKTLAALDAKPPLITCRELLKNRIRNEIDIALHQIPDDIKETTNVKFLKGWINRAMQFM